MKITDVTRTEMRLIDASDKIKYSARCEEHLLRINYKTDGIFHKHLTLEEWITKATELFKDKLKQINCLHLNITREDGCDECLDCGVRNY